MFLPIQTITTQKQCGKIIREAINKVCSVEQSDLYSPQLRTFVKQLYICTNIRMNLDWYLNIFRIS